MRINADISSLLSGLSIDVGHNLRTDLLFANRAHICSVHIMSYRFALAVMTPASGSECVVIIGTEQGRLQAADMNICHFSCFLVQVWVIIRFHLLPSTTSRRAC